MSYIPDDKKLPLLKGMKELLSDPTHWIKGTYSRNQLGGDTTNFTDIIESGTCFCTLGAAYKVAAPFGIIDYISKEFDDEVARLLADCGPETLRYEGHVDVNVATWNDDAGRTHEDIMNGLTCAIEKLEKPNG